MTIVAQSAPAEDNVLLNLVKAARVNGKDYNQIEAMYGIPAARAESIMKAHYANKIASVDPNEYRMLQLDRLESLIDVMQQMAQMGNIKSAETLIKLFEQINELLGLNLQATKTEIRIITEEQSTVVYEMVNYIVKGILRELLEPILTEHQQQLALIEDKYDEKISDLYNRAIDEIVVPATEGEEDDDV